MTAHMYPALTLAPPPPPEGFFAITFDEKDI